MENNNNSMSVVVNVLLSLPNVLSPHPDLCDHGGKVMYFMNFCFRYELGFLNCDDICICVVNMQPELLQFLVDLQYNKISLTFTVGSMFLCGVCSYAVAPGLSVRLSWYHVWWVR